MFILSQAKPHNMFAVVNHLEFGVTVDSRTAEVKASGIPTLLPLTASAIFICKSQRV